MRTLFVDGPWEHQCHEVPDHFLWEEREIVVMVGDTQLVTGLSPEAITSLDLKTHKYELRPATGTEFMAGIDAVAWSV